MDSNPSFDRDRYARQTVLPEIGAAGQARLAASRVLVVGAGGLGTPALFYLAAAGVGTLGIVDDDEVEISNLHRQILYTHADAGRSKANAAAERLTAFNPEVRIEAHATRLAAANAIELIGRYDLVLDATDRLSTKFLINDAAAKAGRPSVYGSALGFEAQIAVFDARLGPCLRCLFPEPPAIPAQTCAEAGVLGAVLGIAGSLQALEAIKWILAADKTTTLRNLLGRLWLLDGRTLATRVVTLERDPACPICRHMPEEIELVEAAANVPTIQATELSRLDGVLLIDVRERDEWNTGHLPGARHLPLSHLVRTGTPELPASATYVVYCAHGMRSQTAAQILIRAGYRNVSSLTGGLAALTDAKSGAKLPTDS